MPCPSADGILPPLKATFAKQDQGEYMKGISINGKKLHELMLPLVQYQNCSSVVSMQYPKHRIYFEQTDGGVLRLSLPSNLALELYRTGIIPQDKSCSFPVIISGRSVGKYKVVEFLYPNSSDHSGNVFLKLQKQYTR
jgi:hypothetical protein